MPYDFPRPQVQRFGGDSIQFTIRPEETSALKQLALNEGATLFMVLLTAFQTLLWKLSSQEDIVTGTPTAGRRHADLEPIIGMFVNTLALRLFPSGEKTFTQFLAETKPRTLNAFENQEFQFEDLVEQVAVTRDAGRQPLFDTMLVLQNIITQTGNPEASADSPNSLTVEPYTFETGQSLFDLVFTVFEGGERLMFRMDYSTSIFKKETVQRFSDYFKRILASVSNEPDTRLYDIDILSEEEKQRLLFGFNDTNRDYQELKYIHLLFEEQALKIPDQVAVIGMLNAESGSGSASKNILSLTYAELNKRSDRAAALLTKQGVSPGSIVGIMLERSIDMVCSILGVLKAGAAYLPI
ncbi:MAG: AMP-binding protein, partial [bacterium]|nr:AMP-binding protein [bacterium]